MLMEESFSKAQREHGEDLRIARRASDEWREDYEKMRDIRDAIADDLDAAIAEIASLKERLNIEQAKLLSLNAHVELGPRKRSRNESLVSYDARPSSSNMSRPPSTWSGPATVI